MKKKYNDYSKSLMLRIRKAASKLIVVALCTTPLTMQAEDDDFDMLMSRIRADQMYNPDTATIAGYITNMNSNGSYSDITYTKTDRTNWEPLNHIDRLVAMSTAYVNPQNYYYQADSLYEKIVKGIYYWQEVNPYCSNWWYNQIAEPQRLGVIFIMMKAGKKQIPDSLATVVLQRWKNDGGNPSAQTGANRTDVALHWLYRGCIQKDASVLNTALKYIYDPMRYTTGEGFQVDNSYFQHGQQLYIGGYGDALLAGVLQVAEYTMGTDYAMDATRIELLGKFVRETFTDVIRGATSNFDCLGRGMSRIGALRKTSNWTTYVRRMKNLDTAHADTYDAILKRINGEAEASYKITPKHTHYFRGDYTLHMRPKYNFSVRTVSTRTCRNEYGNGENLKTYFLSDGCTDIARTGNEYYNLMPLWDWNRIPGTTAPKLSTIPKAASDWQTKGTSTFAGGVSDSLYGASAYEYYDTYNSINTGGKKGWFFFDDEVVCLGAGIKSSSRTYTTIDQNWGTEQVRIGMKSGNIVELNKQTSDKTFKDTAQWVLHNGIGYCFPAGGRIVVNNKDVSGKWYTINTTESSDVVKGRVFTVAIDHLVPSSKKSSYAYIVAPEKTEEELQSYTANCPIEIAENNDTVQVVHHKGLGIYEMIFYSAAEFKDDSIHVVVDAPCALLFKNLENSTLTFHIADPAQAQKDINVNVKTEALGYMRTGAATFSDSEAQYAGQTRTITLTPQSEIVKIESLPMAKETLDVVIAPRTPRAGEPFGVFVKGAPQKAVVEIYNMAGILVANTTITNGDDIMTLPSAGVYVMRVVSGGLTRSVKMLVK